MNELTNEKAGRGSLATNRPALLKIPFQSALPSMDGLALQPEACQGCREDTGIRGLLV